MTPQRKINILNKVIKRFEEIIPKFDEDKRAYFELGFFGICSYCYYRLFTSRETTLWNDGEENLTKFFKREFRVAMPDNNGKLHKWSLTKKGYQARVRACKKAVKYWKKQIEKGKKK